MSTTKYVVPNRSFHPIHHNDRKASLSAHGFIMLLWLIAAMSGSGCLITQCNPDQSLCRFMQMTPANAQKAAKKEAKVRDLGVSTA